MSAEIAKRKGYVMEKVVQVEERKQDSKQVSGAKTGFRALQHLRPKSTAFPLSPLV